MYKCKYTDEGLWHKNNHEVDNIKNYKCNKYYSTETFGEYDGELPEGYAFAKQSVIDSDLVEALYGEEK